MFQTNVKLKEKKHLSAWRKISIGSWKPIGDSQVYATVEVNATAALEYIEDLKEKGVRITLTHIAGMACGQMIKDTPQINSILRLGNLYPRQDIDIFFQTASNDPNDLSGHVIRNIDKKTIPKIADDMKPKVSSIKSGNDKDYQKIKSSMSLIPAILMRPILGILGFILYSLNLWSPKLGTPKDSFGSMMITNVGSLGINHALVPLVPYSRIPLILALCKTHDKVVLNAENIPFNQSTINACFTFDHRIIDGVHGAKLSQIFKKYFENPYLFEISKD
jgi:pyruvate/2-oxoglutarate dehydrogenase complex dihydrolipoamide acyltransferase (E2) component